MLANAVRIGLGLAGRRAHTDPGPHIGAPNAVRWFGPLAALATAVTSRWEI